MFAPSIISNELYPTSNKNSIRDNLGFVLIKTHEADIVAKIAVVVKPSRLKHKVLKRLFVGTVE